MQLVCKREGRFGFHVGDVVNVPDDTTGYDTTYFNVVDPAEVAKREAAAKAEKEAAQAEAKKSATEDKAKLAADLAEVDKLKAVVAEDDESEAV